MNNSNRKDITEIIDGSIDSSSAIHHLLSSAAVKMCLCSPCSNPSDLLATNDYKKEIIDASQRGVKLEIVTQISQDNIHQFKELTKLAQVRHLDGVKLNLAVTETECVAFAVSKEHAVIRPPRLLYSNANEIVKHHQIIFDTLWSNAVPASIRINELEGRSISAISTEKTEMIYGEEQIVNTIVAWQYASQETWNLCLSSAVPGFSMSERIKKGYSDAVARGIKIRYITEITKDNLQSCKEIMQFAQLRHLEGLLGNFVVSEKEYLGEASGKDFLSHIIYSNRKEIVEQQNYIFENLWNNGISAEKRIQLIEKGTIPLETKLIEDNNAIAAKIKNQILNSNEIIACSQTGLLQIVHDNFFDLYREVLFKYKTRQHGGVRLIVTIDRNTIEMVKNFMDLGVQIRHVKNLLPLSFVVTDKEVQVNLEDIPGRKIIQSMLTSNEPIYLRQFTSAFNQLWDEGVDAKLRINDIDEGNDNEIKVIQHPSSAAELYANTIRNAKNEILLIFPTIGAFMRQKKLGILELLKSAAEQRGAKVRILMPSYPVEDALTADEMKLIKKQDREEDTCTSNLDIRHIETMSATATILIVDKRISLVMELKNDSKGTFFEAIGLSTYSSSKGGVLSYVAMFENLWIQTDLLRRLKEAYEQLKINDRMQKEFINVAAHELRTPIQPILSLSETLRSDLPTGESQELLDIIIRNAERLQRLASDILDVTRIEGQSFELNIEGFDLNQLLMHILAGYKEQVKKYNGQLKLTYRADGNDKKKIPVDADKARITQVISNLIDNAFRFTNCGEIIVSTETKNNKATVTVKDSGTGIHESIMPRLFSKFATKSITGTGLGLFISKSIIEAHGGAIKGGNNINGNGATFKFTLPLKNL